MGYRTRVSEPGPDRGIDIVAHKDDLGVRPPTIIVQVKSGEGDVNEAAVSELSGRDRRKTLASSSLPLASTSGLGISPSQSVTSS
jgi:predicted Mrr-cat superfamily restriction endonuclease